MNAIRYIRKNVFRLKQQEFAAIAGVQQSTVSRWERGEASPSLEEMSAIREAAKGKRGWSDKLFFATPSQPSQPDRIGAA